MKSYNVTIIRRNGGVEWRTDGILHRFTGPAVERRDGTREWWCDGKRHREDGPAVVHPDGWAEWWRHGKKIAERRLGPAARYALVMG
jgi:hypothetical protein